MPEKNADSGPPVLVLFRHDLRIADNGALAAAADCGKPVLPVFVLDEDGARPPGAASRWWLHHSLAELAAGLKDLGTGLVLRRGRMGTVVRDILKASAADTVYWNRRYEPAAAETDGEMKVALRAGGITCQSFDGQLLHEPSRLKTGAGGAYKVYTPFWKALSAGAEPRDPIDPPRELLPFKGRPDTEKLDDWGLLPGKPDWSAGLQESWTPGERGARRQLEAFVGGKIKGYSEGRDMPGLEATSLLSPHLAHGEITPFQVFAALRTRRPPQADADKFRKEVGWREFCWHLLFHNADLARTNYDTAFDGFEWRGGKRLLRAWQRGLTGYPIVDAGMRELWRTGFMQNRVRMIAASFLIKHLMVDWREGERWFWDTLVDADAANNPANWQWVAGSGADASPYFRIFNPVLQGEKFDPRGEYVRRYVPELERMPDRFVHRPWEAPEEVMRKAGVKLGRDYPVPLVDHAEARERALGAYKSMRGRTE